MLERKMSLECWEQIERALVGRIEELTGGNVLENDQTDFLKSCYTWLNLNRSNAVYSQVENSIIAWEHSKTLLDDEAV